MIYRATKVCNISAGHQLDLPYDSPCCNCHGHNYRIAVTVETAELNDCGMVCDFSLIKEAIYRFDHVMVEEVIPICADTFKEEYGNATAENMARAVWDMIDCSLHNEDPGMGNKDAKVVRVEVGETGGNIVTLEAGP